MNLYFIKNNTVRYFLASQVQLSINREVVRPDGFGKPLVVLGHTSPELSATLHLTNTDLGIDPSVDILLVHDVEHNRCYKLEEVFLVDNHIVHAGTYMIPEQSIKARAQNMEMITEEEFRQTLNRCELHGRARVRILQAGQIFGGMRISGEGIRMIAQRFENAETYLPIKDSSGAMCGRIDELVVNEDTNSLEAMIQVNRHDLVQLLMENRVRISTSIREAVGTLELTGAVLVAQPSVAASMSSVVEPEKPKCPECSRVIAEDKATGYLMCYNCKKMYSHEEVEKGKEPPEPSGRKVRT